MSVALLEEDRIVQPEDGCLYDYVLEKYAPAATLSKRLHSASAFRFFLRSKGWLERIWPMIELLRARLGRDQTVWGVKRLPDGSPGVELYFYNHCRNASGNPKSVTRLAQALGPFLEIDARIDERLPYLMCSLELDAEVLETGRSRGFRVYVAGTRAVQGYDGISYLASGGELIRENVYCFYRRDQELDLVRQRVATSWRAGRLDQREKWLDRRVLDCFTICFATKAHSDALYFSRVGTEPTIALLGELFPDPFVEMLAHHRDEFAQLRWDIGYDFAAEGVDLDQSTLRKIGVYGFC